MTAPRYPVYVISKGRADCCLTANFLVEDGTPFRLVVEPQERAAYAERYGDDRVLVLPFSNLGRGSIPARNWVWEHSKEAGHERHWILDDNIRYVARRYKARRIRCQSGPTFAIVEDFVDRYENVAIAGLNYTMFVPDNRPVVVFFQNVRVYSCLLILNALPYRWRGRYNEDTDLSLQVLSGGWCTILTNAFMINKMRTMTMKGGNTTDLYRGDGRLKMARELARRWPHVVDIERKWGRPQHVVKRAHKQFDTQLRLRPGVDLSKLPKVDECGLELTQVTPIRSERIQRLLDQSKRS